MLKIAVCDDHNDICSQVENYTLNICKSLGVKCEIDVYYTGERLCAELSSGESYDLVFLDIELDKLSGFDVGNIIRDVCNDDITQIAYISSKTEYAMKLFNSRPIDFLIKPLSYSSIEKVIANAIRIKGIDSDVFVYKYGHDINNVKISDIMYFKSEKRKIHIIMKDRKDEFYETLEKIYNEQLRKYNFMYIHKSYLVNYRYIRAFGYESLIMTNGDCLPISRSKAKEVRDFQLEIERRDNNE